MHILFISPYFPYPLNNGGKVRIYNLIKHLSKRHRITLLTLYDSEKEKLGISKLQEFGEIVAIPHKYFSKWHPKSWINMLSLTPRVVMQFHNHAMFRSINKIIKTQSVDLVQVEFIQMAQYLPTAKNLLTILANNDIPFLLLNRGYFASNTLERKIFYRLQAAKMKRYEKLCCRKYHAVLTVSENDKQTLSQLLKGGEDKIFVIPNGVDVNYYQRLPIKKDNNKLVFIGWMPFYGNADAMKYFYKEILPLIRREIPEVQLTIIGEDPFGYLTELKKDNKIVLTGYVDDTRPILSESSVFIAPIRIGGGTKLKLLEAMAMELPVVSTSVGCEGLNVTHEENILIADDPKEFASHVTKLLKESELREKIGKQAREFVKKKYNWEVIVAQLEELYYYLMQKYRNLKV